MKLAHVVNRNDIQNQGQRPRIPAEVIDQVAQVNVDTAANRHKMRKPDVFFQRPIERGDRQRLRLRNEGHVPLFRQPRRQTRVQTQPRHNDAETVRAQNAHLRVSNLKVDNGMLCLLIRDISQRN